MCRCGSSFYSHHSAENFPFQFLSSLLRVRCDTCWERKSKTLYIYHKNIYSMTLAIHLTQICLYGCLHTYIRTISGCWYGEVLYKDMFMFHAGKESPVSVLRNSNLSDIFRTEPFFAFWFLFYGNYRRLSLNVTTNGWKVFFFFYKSKIVGMLMSWKRNQTHWRMISNRFPFKNGLNTYRILLSTETTKKVREKKKWMQTFNAFCILKPLLKSRSEFRFL